VLGIFGELWLDSGRDRECSLALVSDRASTQEHSAFGTGDSRGSPKIRSRAAQERSREFPVLAEIMPTTIDVIGRLFTVARVSYFLFSTYLYTYALVYSALDFTSLYQPGKTSGSLTATSYMSYPLPSMFVISGIRLWSFYSGFRSVDITMFRGATSMTASPFEDEVRVPLANIV
jgi:hypothetical protein